MEMRGCIDFPEALCGGVFEMQRWRLGGVDADECRCDRKMVLEISRET